MTVLAAHAWRSNAELIADVATLWIRPDDLVVDVTYGKGVWWRRYRPSRLVTHDLALDGVDFRDLPEADASVDVVAFDPPYVSTGGRKTSTIGDFNRRYGLTDAPRSPVELQQMINAGLVEARRVLRPKGVALVKVKDYVSSGSLWPGSHLTLTASLTLGFELVDRFTRVGAAGPQPGGRRQVHARQNLSTLLVLAARR